LNEAGVRESKLEMADIVYPDVANGGKAEGIYEMSDTDEKLTFHELEIEKLIKSLEANGLKRKMMYFLDPIYPPSYASYVKRKICLKDVKTKFKSKTFNARFKGQLEGPNADSGKAYAAAEYMSALFERGVERLEVAVAEKFGRDKVEKDHKNRYNLDLEKNAERRALEKEDVYINNIQGEIDNIKLQLQAGSNKEWFEAQLKKKVQEMAGMMTVRKERKMRKNGTWVEPEKPKVEVISLPPVAPVVVDERKYLPLQKPTLVKRSEEEGHSFGGGDEDDEIEKERALGMERERVRVLEILRIQRKGREAGHGRVVEGIMKEYGGRGVVWLGGGG